MKRDIYKARAMDETGHSQFNSVDETGHIYK